MKDPLYDFCSSLVLHSYLHLLWKMACMVLSLLLFGCQPSGQSVVASQEDHTHHIAVLERRLEAAEKAACDARTQAEIALAAAKPKAVVQTDNRPEVVVVTAPWCQVCKPAIAELKRCGRYRVKVVQFDAQLHPEVKSLPYFWWGNGRGQWAVGWSGLVQFDRTFSASRRNDGQETKGGQRPHVPQGGQGWQ